VVARYPTGIGQKVGPMDQEETEMFLVGIHGSSFSRRSCLLTVDLRRNATDSQ
jgi:uncharacterized SAM-dependent methyltransferase